MNKAFFYFASCAFIALFSGCQTAPDKSKARALSDFATTNFTSVSLKDQLDPGLLLPSERAFTLGPGDRLEIEILGRPTTRTTTFVGPDGKLYFYLLPGLDVWGLTLTQARDLMQKELGKYFSEPEVVLTLREVGSKQIWLLGRLNRPGIYPISAPITLLESLALAGGTSRATSQYSTDDLADLRHSFVMRQGKILPVDFYRLLREGDTSQNIVLQPDDFVFVRSTLSQEVYVLGAVNMPRAVPYSEQMTLVSALAIASGPSRYDFLARFESGMPKDALLSHVAIVRGSLAEPRIAVVNAGAVIKGKAADIPLEPGDIVYVPNSPFRYLKSYLNLIVNSFVSTVAANEGIRAGGGGAAVGVSVPVGGR